MKPETFICKECGAEEIPSRWHNGKRLARRQFCYTCDYWLHSVPPNGQTIMRADGEVYEILPDLPQGKPGMRGYGGREFRFKKLETGEVTVSHNVWHRGTVPERFRDRLPDDARILKIGEES
jgi:hypothetical protein